MTSQVPHVDFSQVAQLNALYLRSQAAAQEIGSTEAWGTPKWGRGDVSEALARIPFLVFNPTCDLAELVRSPVLPDGPVDERRFQVALSLLLFVRESTAAPAALCIVTSITEAEIVAIRSAGITDLVAAARDPRLAFRPTRIGTELLTSPDPANATALVLDHLMTARIERMTALSS